MFELNKIMILIDAIMFQIFKRKIFIGLLALFKNN